MNDETCLITLAVVCFKMVKHNMAAKTVQGHYADLFSVKLSAILAFHIGLHVCLKCTDSESSQSETQVGGNTVNKQRTIFIMIIYKHAITTTQIQTHTL